MPCEDMKKMIGVIPICNPRVIVPCEDMKKNDRNYCAYMQPEVIVPCEDQKNDRGYCALYAIQGLLCPVKT